MARAARSVSMAAALLWLTVPLGAGWTPARRLSHTAGESANPEIAVAGGRLHVVWRDDTAFFWTVLYTRSSSCGKAWSEPVTVAAADGVSILDIGIAATGRHVHLAWREYDHEGRHQVYYSHSSDAGHDWSAARRLSGRRFGARAIDLAAEDEVVWVTWVEGREETGPSRLVVRRSLDWGATWGEIAKISPRSPSVVSPRMVAEGDRVHLAWGDRPHNDGDQPAGVYHSLSLDQGGEWSRGRRVDESPGLWPEAISARDQALHLLSLSSPGYKQTELHLQTSLNRGESWQPAKLLNSPARNGSMGSVAAAAAGVQAVWIDRWQPFGRLFERHRHADGSWSRRLRLAGRAAFPSLAIGERTRGSCGDVPHLVYSRRPAGRSAEIFYRRGTDGTDGRRGVE